MSQLMRFDRKKPNNFEKIPPPPKKSRRLLVNGPLTNNIFYFLK